MLRRGFLGGSGLSLVSAALSRAPLDPLVRAIAAASNGGPIAGEQIRERRELAAFYRARDSVAAWDGDPFQAMALSEAIANCTAEGLVPSRYHAAALTRLAIEGNGDAHATEEVLRTDAFLTLALDLRDGRLRRRRANGDPRVAVRLEDALAWQAVGDVIATMPPPREQYRELRAALAEYRTLAVRGGWGRLGRGGPIRAGDSGTRVEALRARLAATGDLPESGEGAFDESLAAGVRAFQERHGLEPDGVVGKATQEALDVPVEARIRTLVANLERLRWLPRELGEPAVIVNVPAFELVVLEEGKVVFRSNVVVGRPKEWETPSLDATIESVVVAPSWDVPASIAREELAPRAARNPAWARREKIHLIDEAGAELPIEEIDPSAFQEDRPDVRLMQDAGPDNPLGSLKIVFPNSYSVYLHDTPSRTLFARAERAASHGCVRVEQANALAARLLEGSGWDEEMLAAAELEGITRVLPLPRPVDIHLVYQTAFIAEDGRTNFRRDLYRRDEALLSAMGESSERRAAGVPGG